MRRCWLVVAVLLAWGLASAPASRAAARTPAYLPAQITAASLVVLDPTENLTPTAADYNNDYVEITGASGLRVQVSAKVGHGLELFIRCSDASPQIALADFLVKTQTAPGAGGTSMATYTAVTATDQLLWSTGNAQKKAVTVTTDIRIMNLFAYPDAIGAGTTSYTNTLTYTAVEQ